MHAAKKSLQEDISLLTGLLDEVLASQYQPALKQRLDQLQKMFKGLSGDDKKELDGSLGAPSEPPGRGDGVDHARVLPRFRAREYL